MKTSMNVVMRMEWLLVLGLLAFAAGCAGRGGPVAAPTAAGESAQVDRTVECPWLTKVKYPFLSCMKDDEGNIVFDAAPQVLTVSQMPPMDPFVESDAYWGD